MVIIRLRTTKLLTANYINMAIRLPKKFNTLCQADQRQVISDLLKKNREDEAELIKISRQLQRGNVAIKVEDRPDLANLKDLTDE